MSGLERMSLDTLTELIEQYLPIRKWGFVESVRNENEYAPFLIFDSQWCRIRFHLERDMHSGGMLSENLNISYGRLHALNNDSEMIWKGEKCQCWHYYFNLHLLFSFLDSVSVQDAYKANVAWSYERRKPIWHPLIESHRAYVEKNNGFKTKERRSGATLEFHASIWEHYGLRFFELFDLRHPELWEKYRNFLKEVYEPEEQRYKEKGIDHLPFHQVC